MSAIHLMYPLSDPPSELLTDNDKQFTGRYSKPYPAEVLFERICRENGITARLTKPRTPTTTGKIERWHQSLRRDFLDEAGPFADLATAQAAIDAWVHGYNYRRPHQSLHMATPYSLFRPQPAASAPPRSLPDAPILPVHVPDRLAARSTRPDSSAPEKFPIIVDEREIDAVELEMMISPAGRIVLPGDVQLAGHRIPLGAQLAGKRVALRFDGHLLHVIADGLLAKTLPAPVAVEQVTKLRGARVSDQPLPPAPSQAPRAQRRVPKDGIIMVAKQRLRVGASHAGKTVIVVIDDTLFRLLHNDIELSVHTRKNNGPIRRYKASARIRTA